MVSAKDSQLVGFGDEEDWPPGFRFHPTDEELVLYYLKRKICGKKLKLNVIAETDVYKWDPEELPGVSLLKSGDRQWFFFTPRDRKYPNGARSNRATTQGYWKATGKDRCISCNSRAVGLKKTLVFYRGRAPHGERTDWVMHEYTLDEDELKRCQNVQEYFALYKVYKKSGSGPKNGEHYGAPFREEAWNYDCPDFNASLSRDISAEKVGEAVSNGGVEVDFQAPTFTDDIELFLKNLTEELSPAVNEYNHTPSQVRSQEDMQIVTLDGACTNHEAVNPLYGNAVQRNLQGSFDLTRSTDSQMELHEAPKADSGAPKAEEQGVFVIAEDDFLEMNDLLGPEPVSNSAENVGEAMNGILGNVGLSEFDMFEDAAMFLNDIGGEAANQCNGHPNQNQSGPNSGVDQLFVEASSEVVNQPYLGASNPANQLYQSNVDQLYDHLFTDDESLSFAQDGSGLTSAEFYDEQYPGQTSGIIYGSTNNSMQANQRQGGNEESSATSWLSSAVWSFVESIPTTPASAAENALVNRAFTRMSSFSRLRVNTTTVTLTSSVNDPDTVKRSCSKRGFILFPILVAVFAVSWVVIGAVSSVWRPVTST